MNVKAKYDNISYDNKSRPYFVFKKGEIYFAQQLDNRYFFIVTDTQGKQLIFCPIRFFEMFEILDEYEKYIGG